ncbi:MAG: hypothetical protein QM779_15695 [Propionicimonas sp.]|uniref:hypothetical protein n=1 Tax=Propionicimonas sp. TaxID=1955623 RepID=UPI003D09D2D4
MNGLVRDDHSLWSVQQVLAELAALGLSRAAGRWGDLYTINEKPFAIGRLRVLLDPLAALRDVAAGAGSSDPFRVARSWRGDCQQ